MVFTTHIRVNYNDSLSWNKAFWGIIPLANHHFQWGRSQVLIIYQCLYDWYIDMVLPPHLWTHMFICHEPHHIWPEDALHLSPPPNVRRHLGPRPRSTWQKTGGFLVEVFWLWHSQFAMGRSTMFKNGKASISMGHLYHGYVKQPEGKSSDRFFGDLKGKLTGKASW